MMARDIRETTRGMEDSFFSSMFDRQFYFNHVNLHGAQGSFAEYLAIIVGIREDDGQILMEMQQKYLL